MNVLEASLARWIIWSSGFHQARTSNVMDFPFFVTLMTPAPQHFEDKTSCSTENPGPCSARDRQPVQLHSKIIGNRTPEDHSLKSHWHSVHCNSMKNITLSAEETLIEQARLVARAQHKTLNAAFREWLDQYAAQAGGGAAVDALMRRLRHVRSSGPYTRDEMNER
jgi:Acyl carrier protein phosphodiesterase